MDYSLKARCVQAAKNMPAREVYENIFMPSYGQEYPFNSFRRRLQEWKHKQLADEDTLLAGTYPNFTAHHATVQVNAEGRITQAWIKQQQDTLDWLKIRELLTDGLPPSEIQAQPVTGEAMLEIPLFDLHFGVASLETYQNELAEILALIEQKPYDEINILVGQDALHNNDMRGHTAKGTEIDKVDFVAAYKDACVFFRTLIEASVKNAARVKVRYSKGNHDECASWCLFKTLEALYPQCEWDDLIKPRKCIFWNGCFVGFGHCEYTVKSSVLFQNFVLDFPQEFAAAKVREIHSGHLHRESVDDGMMIRRLPSAVPTDEWSSNNGYIGAHKRFQIFEWAPERLKAIYYV